MKAMFAMGCITALGAIHLFLVGDGTVLGILIGALSTIAGVQVAQEKQTK